MFISLTPQAQFPQYRPRICLEDWYRAMQWTRSRTFERTARFILAQAATLNIIRVFWGKISALFYHSFKTFSHNSACVSCNETEWTRQMFCHFSTFCLYNPAAQDAICCEVTPGYILHLSHFPMFPYSLKLQHRKHRRGQKPTTPAAKETLGSQLDNDTLWVCCYTWRTHKQDPSYGNVYVDDGCEIQCSFGFLPHHG